MSSNVQTLTSFARRNQNPFKFPEAKAKQAPLHNFGERTAQENEGDAVLVTQQMIDLYQVNQDGFELPQDPSGTVLSTAFTFKTSNKPPTAYSNTDSIALNWNGVTRILITPTMIPLNTNLTDQYFTGFKATLSSFVLFGTETNATDNRAEADKNTYNPFMKYQGVGYTVSVLTGQDLSDELQATFNTTETKKALADALASKNAQNTLVYGSESLVMQQNTTNYLSQYNGTYAVEAKDSKTEPIWESCVIGGKITDYVTVTVSNAGQSSATIAVSRSTSSRFTVNKDVPVASAAIPIVAMIRVDFPEDLISEVYTSSSSTANRITTTVANIVGQLCVKIGYSNTGPS